MPTKAARANTTIVPTRKRRRPSSLGWIILLLVLLSLFGFSNTAEALAANSNKQKRNSFFCPLTEGERPVLSEDCHSILDAHKNNIQIQDTKSKGMGAFFLPGGGRGRGRGPTAGNADASSSTTVTMIHAGDFIGEYTGEILRRRQVEARYWDTRNCQTADRRWKKSRRERQQGISGDYLFDMGNDLFLDAEDSDISSWCRFINHAPENIMGTDAKGNAVVIGTNPDCNVESRSSATRSTRPLMAALEEKGLQPKANHDENETVAMPRLWFVARRDIVSGEELLYDYGDDYW
jgi:hypothetical protein